VITLYQPWATWVMRGWKIIETRTHNRFSTLNGKTILIHAGQRTDWAAFDNPYLTPEQLCYKPEEVINGFILGEVSADYIGKLGAWHSNEALIDCLNVDRFGLYLGSPCTFVEPIEAKGERGIWYFDTMHMRKVTAADYRKQMAL
jgi:hypothetical protein